MKRDEPIQFTQTSGVGVAFALDQIPLEHERTEVGRGLLHRIIAINRVSDEVTECHTNKACYHVFSIYASVATQLSVARTED